jgi:hypothetical protein
VLARLDTVIAGGVGSKTVIAGEAKQSISPRKERTKDGLLRFARNDGGVSSTPRLFDSIAGASEYWIIRLRG